MSGSVSASRLLDIPDLPEDRDPAFRRIHQFDDFWSCSALRMMENSFDNAHFAFVHKNTFGDIAQPKPEKYEITETDYGFVAETIVPVKNPPEAARITGTTEPMDEAQDAQRLVHAVLPHDGHGLSVGPQAPYLQFRNADRRRLDPARSRSSIATTARRIARPRSFARGTARSSRRIAKFLNRPTRTRSST